MYRRLAVSVAFLIVVVAALLCLAYFFGGVGRRSDFVVVGVASDYEPFSFVGENGVPVGFDVDLISALVEKVGKKVEWKAMGVSELFGSVQTKKVDVALAGFLLEQVAGTGLVYVPYKTMFVSNFYCMMCLADRQLSEDKLSGCSVGVQSGSAAEAYLDSLRNGGSFVDLEVVSMPFGDMLVDAVRDGGVDLALISNYQFQRIESRNGKVFQCIRILKDSADTDGVKEYGMVMRSDCRLKGDIEGALSGLIESGEYDLLRMNWLTGYGGVQS